MTDSPPVPVHWTGGAASSQCHQPSSATNTELTGEVIRLTALLASCEADAQRVINEALSASDLGPLGIVPPHLLEPGCLPVPRVNASGARWAHAKLAIHASGSMWVPRAAVQAVGTPRVIAVPLPTLPQQLLVPLPVCNPFLRARLHANG